MAGEFVDSPARTYTALLTTTLDNYRKILVDQIFDVYPFLSWLNGSLGMALRGNSVKRMEDGGVTIREHLLFEQNSTVDSYSGAEIIDTTLQEGMTIASYNWKQYAGTYGITGLEKRSNMGETQLINLLQAKLKQLELSFRDRLSVDAFADGTGNGGKNLTGLDALVSDTSNTVGGLDDSTRAWWVPYRSTAIGSFAASGLAEMRTGFNTITFGNDKPDFIVTTQSIFEFYEAALQPQERFMSNKVADGGFMNLTFKNVPIVFDRDCGTGLMYMLNSRYVSWVVHQDADMVTRPFTEPENQDVITAKMILQGNMTTNNRRKLAVLAGFTA
jgi:hypothetical protein